ncbi:MAG: hypothetical protein ACTSPK_13860, partial [Candidatus Heimdallarchaeota archaeon]
MKNSRKNVFVIIMLLSLVLIKPLNIESKVVENEVVIFEPQAMGVVQRWATALAPPMSSEIVQSS